MHDGMHPHSSFPRSKWSPSSWYLGKVQIGNEPLLLSHAQVGSGTEELKELLVDPKQLRIRQNVFGHFGPALAKHKI